MVWLDITNSLLTVLTLTICIQQITGNLPLYTEDIPEHKQGETIGLLEKTLLNILGMREKPKRSKRDVKIPQYMIDLYKQQVSDPDYMSMYFNTDNSLHANTARSYSLLGTKTHKTDNNIVNLYFNVTNIPDHEDIVSAEVQLFPNNTAPTNGRYRVEVHEILSAPHSVDKSITRLIDTKIVRPSNSSWIQLDITPAVHRWKHRNTKTQGIQLHVKNIYGDKTPHSHVRLRRDVSQSEDDWTDQKPLVVVYSHDRTLRTKRASKKRNRGSKRVKSECQRHEMKVDFKDVGWQDWILAPQEYDAYYCSGECPFPLSDHLNATNHAIIQTLVNEVEPEAVPPACCVPTDLSPISMLYLDGENVALKNYPDMVVEACGCR